MRISLVHTKLGWHDTRTNDQNEPLGQRGSSVKRLHAMDDRTLEVTVENGSDVNEMEEQPND
jgi:hypothetical protein